MNATVIAPEVQEFLTAVRTQLADLDPDEQREILDGLEADLTDLVAERGRGALGDPVAYARELRAAAGLEPERGKASRRPRRSPRVASADLLDAAHEAFQALVARLPGEVPAVLTWCRPVWWVVRAWAAVQLVDMYGGRSRMYVVPDLRGLGWLVLLAAVVASVAVGRGSIWPGGSGRGVFARVVVLALNLFALVVTPVAISQVVDDVNQRYDRGAIAGFQQGFHAATRENELNGPKAGLFLDGTWVSNIYPYDATGRPLVGVQLFDQTGRPINVITQPEYPVEECGTDGCAYPADTVIDERGDPLPRVSYPWTNGAAQVLNVFPIPSRVQDGEDPSPTAFAETDPPAIGPFPLASVPQVSLPGIEASKQRGVDR